MITTIALSLLLAPTIYGSVGAIIPLDSSLVDGAANRYGVILASRERAQFIGDRFRAKPSLIYTTSPSLTNAYGFKAERASSFLEALPDGCLIDGKAFDRKGKYIKEAPAIYVNGANSKGDLVGFSRESTSRLDRATAVLGGKKEFVSYPPAPDYVAILDQFSLFSQAFDIDELGRVLVVSLPSTVDGNKVNPLKPYIIENGKQIPLTIHVGYTDVFPLKFAFDGSIIGWAWEESTITKTGWAGGFGQAYSTTFLRWPSARSTTNPSVGWTLGNHSIVNIADASGPYAIGKVRHERIGTQSPAVWVNGQPKTLKMPSNVDLHDFLGFVTPTAAACLGKVKGNWSLFIVKLPVVKTTSAS